MRLLGALSALLIATASWAQAPLSLDDLYTDPDVRDVALSPSGKYVVITLWREKSDLLVLMNLETKATSALVNIGHDVAGKLIESRIVSVTWKNEDRILFRSYNRLIEQNYKKNYLTETILKIGERLYAVNRDGSHLVRLLGTNAEGALDDALMLGNIASFLPNDADNLILFVNGADGPSLFKVNVNTGRGVLIEKPRQRNDGWWLDLDGNAVLRQETVNGSIRILRREPNGDWKKVLSYRPNEYAAHPEYDFVGPSDQRGRYYVLAHPAGKDRRGLYLYDAATESFGDVLFENPQYDLSDATISRDGKRVVNVCYIAHVRVCEFTNRKADSHMRGIRKFFRETANVHVIDTSDDDKTLLLLVEGPSEAPTYYYYRVDDARIESIGPRRNAYANRPLPTASVVRWKSRDGLDLTGYLIRPPGAEKAAQMPLLVMPHGGPEARDEMEFNNWTQFFAARGYAIFQPNFRGSEGFGKAFVDRGQGEWGRSMQDDITDGVDALIADGSVDAKRICIVGASYGGYAALMGAVKTPEKYRCAVSISGISDLEALVRWRRAGWTDDSEGYQYILKMIGNPDKDAERMAANSPARLAGAIRIPVLLIHGELDGITPISQSERMKAALDKAGKRSEFIRLPEVGHSGWPKKSEIRALMAVDAFLLANLGSGLRFRPAQP